MAQDRLFGNENRAHVGKASVYNPMTDMPAGGGVASARPPNDMPPSIRGDAPMLMDPHANGRHSFDNQRSKPPERSRASYTSELARTVLPQFAKTRKTS